MTSVREVSCANIVSHVEPRLFDTLEDTGPTAVYKRMLAASFDFSCQRVAVCELGGEHVGRAERARLAVIGSDEGLGSSLGVSSTRCAFAVFYEDVVTTCDDPVKVRT